MAASAQYLYGLDVDTHAWESMPYKSVLLLKRELSKQRVIDLSKASFFYRDFANINACKAADKHNDMLLKELE